MNLTKPKAIPAGSYFAYLKSDEHDIFLRREVDGSPAKQEDRLVRASSAAAVQDFEFAPDGQRFFCTLKDGAAGPDDVSLCVVDKGGQVRRFDGYSSVFASWTQAGRKLLVRSQSSRGDQAAAFVLDTATWDRTPIDKPADLFFKLGIHDPEFLVSYKKQSFNERSVFGIDPAGKEYEIAREKHEIRELKFSGDRKKAAYFYSYPYHKWILGWRIVVIDMQSLARTVVFDAVAESLFRLRWAPDSRGLSFICGTAGIPDNRLMDMDQYETMGSVAPDLMGNTYIVFTMKADGSDRREIVRDCWKFDWVRVSDFSAGAVDL